MKIKDANHMLTPPKTITITESLFQEMRPIFEASLTKPEREVERERERGASEIELGERQSQNAILSK